MEDLNSLISTYIQIKANIYTIIDEAISKVFDEQKSTYNIDWIINSTINQIPPSKLDYQYVLFFREYIRNYILENGSAEDDGAIFYVNIGKYGGVARWSDKRLI